jgi:glyoxylate reductase
MATVVVSAALPGDAEALLAREHDLRVLGAPGEATPEHVALAMRDADALLSMLTDPLPREAIAAAASRLRVIGNCAVGYDNVDVAAAREHGVIVCNTPNVLTDATADFSFALLLSAARRVSEADRFVRAGRFHGWRIDLMLGQALSGRTLGILGLGRVGQAVARRARGFGLRIAYSGRTRASRDLEAKLEARWVERAELFSASDFLSVHVPGGAETRHLVDAPMLARMKPSAVLVNTSRGSVVDETALAAALERRQIAAAGLDVFEREPEVEPRLLALDNVVLAPHVASATLETRAAMARAVAEDIQRVLRGEAPFNRVA